MSEMQIKLTHTSHTSRQLRKGSQIGMARSLFWPSLCVTHFVFHYS